jgi:hypothetical protein
MLLSSTSGDALLLFFTKEHRLFLPFIKGESEGIHKNFKPGKGNANPFSFGVEPSQLSRYISNIIEKHCYFTLKLLFLRAKRGVIQLNPGRSVLIVAILAPKRAI